MRINNNLQAANATRMLGMNNAASSKSMEKLSSGYRINKAGDDAAGLAISEKMRGQIKGLNQASKNAQDGISLLQTAEGGLNESHSILQRMRELAVQGANDTLQTQDRTAIQTEMDQLSEEVTRIADKTKFNGATLLKGTFGVSVDTTNAATTLDPGAFNITSVSVSGAKASTTYTLQQDAAGQVEMTDGAGNTQRLTGLAATFTGTMNFDKLGVSITVAGADLSGAASWGGDNEALVTTANADKHIQIGADEDEALAINIGNMDATASGLNVTGARVSIATYTDAKASITNIQGAIDTVSSERSKLGAWQNRLEYTINNLGTTSENLQAAESRIRDVDMAKEMVNYTKSDILNQAAQAMLAKANQAPQGVLQLLR